MIAKKENENVSLRDKRLLTMEEFSDYSGLGLSKARELAFASGSVFRAGRRVLVDRQKFDLWLDNNDAL